MAPLDDLHGDEVLAEFEAIIRGSGHIEPGKYLAPDLRGLVPERRAVNWVNALAAIAREIEGRQGPRRAEMLLRTIGSRMSRDLLMPLPTEREEFEPAINRALSILDWGWVAVLDRQDTVVFEHRPPWPFEKRVEQLRFVLEGFYTEILQRLASNETMHVRLTGKRGGAMVLKWLPAEAMADEEAPPEPSVVVAAPPPAEAPAASFAPAPLEEPVIVVAPAPEPAPQRPVADRKLPPLTDLAARRAAPPRAPSMAPADFTAHAAKSRAGLGPVPVMLVAATVFVGLFAVGMMTSTGDVVGSLLHRFSSVTGTNTTTGGVASASLEKRAGAGDADAQIRLGLQLADSGSATVDYAGAAHWFEAASQSGSGEAQYDLGVLTAEGLGVKRDPVGAAILFMNAATGGFPLAEYRMGAAYQHGIGVKHDAASAAMWYERAARHGVRRAQASLAGLYANGDGVKADPITAYSWYRLAEENGDREATAKRVALYRAMSLDQRMTARTQSAALIGDVNGGRNLVQSPAHPTVDRLIAQIS